MKPTDPLYFPRTELAQRLLISLKDGIMHALTLFAPRRMGKTQFLLNDVKTNAREMGFNVFYFSFMEQIDDNKMQQTFTYALTDFLNEIIQGKHNVLDNLKKIKSLDILGLGVELNTEDEPLQINISRLLNAIAHKSEKPVLMLFDEVQELARSKGNEGLIRSLRTGLDMNQSKIKVIFTGSSTNGLKVMFNDNKAPFFHFAHAIDFPHLDKTFVDFLAHIYQQRTGKHIDTEHFYHIFERLHFTPLYMRAIAQDMIINPDLHLEDAFQYRLSQMDEQGDMMKQWQHLSALERQLLTLIAKGNTTLYSQEVRFMLAEKIGIDNLTTSAIQGKIRRLERNELITRNMDKTLQINNPHLKTWIKENAH